MNVLIQFVLTLLLALPVPGCRSAETDRPPSLDDGWQVATPSEAGLDGEAITAISRDIAAGRYPGIRSYLVVKDGKLVHEAYFEGYHRDSKLRIYSISKSVTAALVGIALEEKLLPGLSATLAELLPERAAAIGDPRARSITLENLLTLTAGWQWDEETHSYGDPRNTHHFMTHSPSWVDAVLGLPMTDTPGKRFVYNTGAVHLIGAILKQATGVHANHYAAEKLLAPLGIENWDWNSDPEGHPACGGTWGGLRLRSRDLAKFGALFMDGGKWCGHQILPEFWVRACLRARVPTGRGGQFGYLWWIGQLELKGRRFQRRGAAGYGGQSITLIPELRLMVVFHAHDQAEDAPIFGPLLRTIAAAIDN